MNNRKTEWRLGHADPDDPNAGKKMLSGLWAAAPIWTKIVWVMAGLFGAILGLYLEMVLSGVVS